MCTSSPSAVLAVPAMCRPPAPTLDWVGYRATILCSHPADGAAAHGAVNHGRHHAAGADPLVAGLSRGDLSGPASAAAALAAPASAAAAPFRASMVRASLVSSRPLAGAFQRRPAGSAPLRPLSPPLRSCRP